MRRKELVTRMALGAVLTSAALSFNGCGFQTVYGPPPDVYEEPVEPGYDPAEEEIEEVYGPPEVFDETDEGS